MTADQRDAFDYLLKRRFRERSIRDLTPLFALGSDEVLRAKLKDALQKFPEALPFQCEEEAASEPRKNRLLETAKIWAAWGDPENYKVEDVPDQPGTVTVIFQAPEPQPEEFERQRQENANSIADFNVVHWAEDSLRKGEVDPRFALKAVIEFARSRDTPELFKVLAEAGQGPMQSSVAAAAAVAACFSTEPGDASWGWSVLARVLRH